MARNPKDNQCWLRSNLFASDGLVRPEDGSKTAQESPQGDNKLQDSPKSAQTTPQEGRMTSLLSFRRGGVRIRAPPPFETWGPRRPQDAPQTSPKNHARAPKRGNEGFSECTKKRRENPQRAARWSQETSEKTFRMR
eukprot:7894912-Pyramimonas_sp.AAC.1